MRILNGQTLISWENYIVKQAGLKCLGKGMLELDSSEVKTAKNSMEFLFRNWYEKVQNQAGLLTTEKGY